MSSVWTWPGLALAAVLVAGIAWLVCFLWLWVKFDQTQFTAPFRIRLEPATDKSWTAEPRAAALADSLREVGFEEAGTSEIPEMPETGVHGLTCASSAVAACMYRRKDRLWVDLISSYQDGSSITYSTVEVGEEMPRPPAHRVVRFPGMTPAALFHRLLQDRPRGKLAQISPEIFPGLLQDLHAAYQNWLAERGGYSIDELRKLVPAVGKLSQESLGALREKVAREALINWWRIQPDVPFPAEELNDCVAIIHDQLSLDQMLFVFCRVTGDWDAGKQHIPASECSPRAAFEALNEIRNGGLIKVLEKTTPLCADFYAISRNEDEASLRNLARAPGSRTR